MITASFAWEVPAEVRTNLSTQVSELPADKPVISVSSMGESDSISNYPLSDQIVPRQRQESLGHDVCRREG